MWTVFINIYLSNIINFQLTGPVGTKSLSVTTTRSVYHEGWHVTVYQAAAMEVMNLHIYVVCVFVDFVCIKINTKIYLFVLRK